MYVRPNRHSDPCQPLIQVLLAAQWHPPAKQHLGRTPEGKPGEDDESLVQNLLTTAELLAWWRRP